MAKCQAITTKGKKCSYEAKNSSNYCGRHDKGICRKICLFAKSPWMNLISLGVAVISIIASGYYFSAGINTSIELAESVLLDINQTYDANSERIYISATNRHPSKRTGTIYLYKLEIDPDKPEQVDEAGLGPGETKNYSLTFRRKYATIKNDPIKTPNKRMLTLPASKAYYVYAHSSISYKLTCDNCPPGGFVRRIPPHESVEFCTSFTPEGFTSSKLPVYEWVDYHLEDIATIDS